jgi:hypothetical protein
MAGPKFDTISLELRKIIFEYVFGRTDIILINYNDTLSVVNDGPEYVIGILCLSKQILAEARPVLASSIRLHLCNTDHAWIRSEVRRYYYPRLRKLYIDTPLLNTDTLDLASFVSLKKIVVGTYFAQFTRRDPKPRLYDRLANIFTSMSKIHYPDVADDVVKEKMLLGSLDRNIKQHSRDLQLKISIPGLNISWLIRLVPSASLP